MPATEAATDMVDQVDDAAPGDVYVHLRDPKKIGREFARLRRDLKAAVARMDVIATELAFERAVRLVVPALTPMQTEILFSSFRAEKVSAEDVPAWVQARAHEMRAPSSQKGR